MDNKMPILIHEFLGDWNFYSKTNDVVTNSDEPYDFLLKFLGKRIKILGHPTNKFRKGHSDDDCIARILRE
jgi:hypothetical protein